MFISILIMCYASVNNNNRIECNSVIPNGQFNSKKDCETYIRARYVDDFECVKMPEIKNERNAN